MSFVPEVPEEEGGGRVDSEQEYIVTIHLAGYGKPEQVKEEYKKVFKRVLGLEFGSQVRSCKIIPVNTIRLD